MANEIHHSELLARAVFEALNNRDPDRLLDRMTENAAFDFPGPGRLEGRDRVRRFLKVLLRQYPRLEFNVREVIAAPDRAVAVWTNEGENRQGEAYANSGVTLVHLKEDKIDFLSDYFKDTSFVR
jgi:uncharacterized protein (TIGR02246 family)